MTPATKQTKNDAGATSASASAIPESEEAGPRSAEDEELQLRILFDNAKQGGGAVPPHKHETKGEWRRDRRRRRAQTRYGMGSDDRKRS